MEWTVPVTFRKKGLDAVVKVTSRRQRSLFKSQK